MDWLSAAQWSRVRSMAKQSPTHRHEADCACHSWCRCGASTSFTGGNSCSGVLSGCAGGRAGRPAVTSRVRKPSTACSSRVGSHLENQLQSSHCTENETKRHCEQPRHLVASGAVWCWLGYTMTNAMAVFCVCLYCGSTVWCWQGVGGALGMLEWRRTSHGTYPWPRSRSSHP